MNNDPIAVLYIITKLELGGAQKICLSLFNELVHDKELETFLVSGPDGTLVPTVIDNENVYILSRFTREVSARALGKELLNFFSLWWLIRTLQRKHKHLVVHTHSTKAGLIGRWAAWCAGVKTRIHTIHGYGFHDEQPKFVWWLVYMLEWFTSVITTHYICVSQKDSTTGKHLLPGFTKKHSIIPAAAQFSQPHYRLARVYTDEKRGFVFGTIACFKPQKNIIDLLRAFAYAYTKHKNIRLEIIGDGALRAGIEKFIAAYNLHDAVILHGWQQDVAPYFAQWDAFVLSSLWEGLPCAVIEARLYNLPVLAYNVGGISEVITSGINGLLYPAHAWLDLAYGMLALATDQQYYQRLAKSHDDLSRFNYDYMLAHHKQLYKNLVSKLKA